MHNYMQVMTAVGARADAEVIAALVVEQRLAACVQILGPVTSTYWWKGKVETAEEWLCIVKTRADLFAEVEQAIQEAHPYETPEIIATPIVVGSKPYFDWVARELKPPSERA